MVGGGRSLSLTAFTTTAAAAVALLRRPPCAWLPNGRRAALPELQRPRETHLHLLEFHRHEWAGRQLGRFRDRRVCGDRHHRVHPAAGVHNLRRVGIRTGGGDPGQRHQGPAVVTAQQLHHAAPAASDGAGTSVGHRHQGARGDVQPQVSETERAHQVHDAGGGGGVWHHRQGRSQREGHAQGDAAVFEEAIKGAQGLLHAPPSRLTTAIPRGPLADALPSACALRRVGALDVDRTRVGGGEEHRKAASKCGEEGMGIVGVRTTARATERPGRRCAGRARLRLLHRAGTAGAATGAATGAGHCGAPHTTVSTAAQGGGERADCGTHCVDVARRPVRCAGGRAGDAMECTAAERSAVATRLARARQFAARRGGFRQTTVWRRQWRRQHRGGGLVRRARLGTRGAHALQHGHRSAVAHRPAGTVVAGATAALAQTDTHAHARRESSAGRGRRLDPPHSVPRPPRRPAGACHAPAVLLAGAAAVVLATWMARVDVEREARQHHIGHGGVGAEVRDEVSGGTGRCPQRPTALGRRVPPMKLAPAEHRWRRSSRHALAPPCPPGALAALTVPPHPVQAVAVRAACPRRCATTSVARGGRSPRGPPRWMPWDVFRPRPVFLGIDAAALWRRERHATRPTRSLVGAETVPRGHAPGGRAHRCRQRHHHNGGGHCAKDTHREAVLEKRITVRWTHRGVSPHQTPSRHVPLGVPRVSLRDRVRVSGRTRPSDCLPATCHAAATRVERGVLAVLESADHAVARLRGGGRSYHGQVAADYHAAAVALGGRPVPHHLPGGDVRLRLQPGVSHPRRLPGLHVRRLSDARRAELVHPGAAVYLHWLHGSAWLVGAVGIRGRHPGVRTCRQPGAAGVARTPVRPECGYCDRQPLAADLRQLAAPEHRQLVAADLRRLVRRCHCSRAHHPTIGEEQYDTGGLCGQCAAQPGARVADHPPGQPAEDRNDRQPLCGSVRHGRSAAVNRCARIYQRSTE
eukprot:ctg_281.g174